MFARALEAARRGATRAALVALAAFGAPLIALAAGTSVVDPPPLTGAYSATWREDVGNVAIIDFAGEYASDLPGGAINSEARAVVAREFFRTHLDDYDFLVVYTTFEFDTGDALALHWGVQNEVLGIGLPEFDNSPAFGSDGRLIGYIDMAATSRHELDPQRSAFESMLSVLGHEMLHQWAARIRFRDEAGEPSEALLGKDLAHWSDLLDTNASVLYGHKWRDNGDGTFTSIATRRFYSDLDLYLAGFLAPEEVSPFVLIDSPGHDAAVTPTPNISVSGTPRLITIDDVIAVEGPRYPPHDEARDDYKIAFVLLAAPGEPIDTPILTGLTETTRRLPERFSAWTGGRAVARVDTDELPLLASGLPEVVEGDEPRVGGAVVQEGIAWLRAQQTVAGYWEDKPSTRLRDTEIALRALTRLDLSFTGQETAREWLASQSPETTDYLARQARALVDLEGDPDPGLAGLAALRNEVDGAWGIAAGFASNPLDTALGVAALASDSDSDPALIEAGRAYLLATRNADGGWSSVAGGPSRTTVTALVLGALTPAGVPPDVAEAALAWLASRQNGDGGFGDSPSTVHDTARVLLTLVDFDAIDRVRAEDAATFLLDLQGESGSWEGSRHKTALAVLALQRFNFPNWRFTALDTEPLTPSDGDRVAVAITVVNDAGATAPATFLRVFDGDPDAGGVQIGSDLAVPPLGTGESAELVVLWDTLDLAGAHRLVAVIDPDDGQAETSEADNRIEVEVGVGVAPSGAELSVVTSSVLAMPANPETLPSTLGISATVRNAGDTGTTGVVVRLYEGTPEAGRPVEELTLDIAARATLPANFTYVLTSSGVTGFTVVVDPDDAVVEGDEDNNRGSASVETAPSVDLEILGTDVTIDPMPALLGSDVRFEVVIRNRGTSPAPSTPVRFEISDGNLTTELGLGAVEIAGGASVVRTVAWRANLAGDLTFIAQVDPQGLLPELDESNNRAVVAFSAGEASGPNLVVSSRDFLVTPDPGLEGNPLTLSALVRNTGTSAAAGVEVAFFDGDPAAGGTQIGETQTVALLAAGAAETVTVEWASIPDAAEKLLFVRADPNEAVVEFSEDDNVGFLVLEVRSLSDLAISQGSLTLTPPFPASGAAVTLDVVVSNLGAQGASDVVVRAYEGAPESGGVAVGGDQLVTLAGSGTTLASFAFTLNPDIVVRDLVVRVDPEGAIAESNLANNSASLTVAGQDRDFFVTERFISPNGDGVQDSTEFFFRLAAPADVVVAVEDLDGLRLRHLAPPFASAIAGDVAWDGLDDFGRVVGDGEYRIVALGAGGSALGEAVVEVDNNRSSLSESIGTPYALNRNLTCELDVVEHFTIARTEEQIVFSHRNGGNDEFARYGRGILRMSTAGANVRTVVPFGEELEVSIDRVVEDLALSEDGERIVYIRRAEDSYSIDKRLFVIGVDGSGAFEVEFISLLGELSSDYVPRRIVAFNGARDEVVVELTDSDYGDRRLVVVPLGGQLPRGLVAFEELDSDVITELKPSPDRSEIAWIRGSGAQLGRDAELVRVSIADGTVNSVQVAPELQSRVIDFDWSPDGDRIAVQIFSIGGPPGELYGVTGDGAEGYPESLFSVSTTDASATFIRELGNGNDGESIAFNPVDGLMYHWSGFSGPQVMETIDLVTGAVTEVTQNFFGHNPREVFGSTYNPGFGGFLVTDIGNNLSSVTTDGVWSTFGVVGDVRGIAFNGGRLYLGERRSDLLYEVDPLSGELLELVEITLSGYGVSGTLALTTNPEDGLLYAILKTSSGTSGRRLATIDPLTGFASDIGPLPEGFSNIEFGAAGRTAPLGLESDFSQSVRVLVFDASGESTAFELPGATEFAGEPERIICDGGSLTWSPQGDAIALDQFIAGVADDELTCSAASGEVYRIDLVVAAVDRVAEYEAGGTAGERGESSGARDLVWDPDEQALFQIIDLADGDEEPDGEAGGEDEEGDGEAGGEDEGGDGEDGREDEEGDGEAFDGDIYAFGLDDESAGDLVRLLEKGEGASVENLGAFPLGRQLLYGYDRDLRDGNSICFERGEQDFWAYQSLLNLTVELRALRSTSAGGVLLQGTASDLNFASYLLEYTLESDPEGWRPVEPASTTPALDERFTVWVPPAPGRYLVRLSASDLAGNTRGVVARVSWSETPDIANLYRDPDRFSPNGDGVRETTELFYRVLQPVMLEFQIYDAQRDLVRTIAREHFEVDTEHSIVWDGRDDEGLPVPDGRYSIAVLGYEFFVTLDRTFPEVLLELVPPYRAPTPPEWAVLSPPTPLLWWAVSDARYLGSTIERAPPGAPDAWVEIFDPDPRETGDRPVDGAGNPLLESFELDLERAVGATYRVVAEDDAGNRSVAIVGPLVEQIIVHGFGELTVDPDGEPDDPPSVTWRLVPYAEIDDENGTGQIAVNSTEVRLEVASTFVESLTTLGVRYRPVGDGEWTDDSITHVEGDEWAWMLPALDTGQNYSVRLRAVDAGGAEHFSNAFVINVINGVAFRGRAAAVPPERRPSELNPVVREGRDVLWAQNDSLVPLADVSLFLSSDSDPRYAIETRVKTVLGRGPILTFTADLAPCNEYRGRVVTITETGGRLISEGTFRTPCLDIVIDSAPVLATECGAPPTNRVEILLAPSAVDPEITLSVLTLARVDDSGARDIVFNVNKPNSVAIAKSRSNQRYSHRFELDTTALPEGVYQYEATLIATSGEFVSRTEGVVVDHTPPDLVITAPLEGQQVCGVPTVDRSGNLRNAVAIEGFIDDANLVTDSNGDGKPDHPAVRLLSPNAYSEQRYSRGGVLAEVFDVEGPVTVQLEALDKASYKACTLRSFTMDSLARAGGLRASPRLFSPNGDGEFDEVELIYSADEPVTLTIEVFAAITDARGVRQVVGSALGAVESALALPVGDGVSAWDGSGFGGVLADGLYGLVATFVDGCGNRLEQIAFVTLDNTGPEISLTYPRTGDPLAMIVEPLGTVFDPHMNRFSIDFGVGDVPETWAVIDNRRNAVEDAVLGVWNTFGLEGPHVLRVVAADDVANRSELLVPLVFAERVNLINELETVPELFSPNGDGRRETTAIRIGLEEESLLTVRILGPGPVRELLVDALAGIGPRVVAWDGADDDGTPLGDGTYTVRVTAVLASNTAIDQQEEVTVELDRTPPNVEIARPAGGFVSSAGQIIGTVTDSNLEQYVVSFAENPAAPAWFEVELGDQPIGNAGLGSLEELDEGDYVLRVEAVDTAENRTDLQIPFVVDDTAPAVALEAPEPGTILAGAGGPTEVKGTVEEQNLASWTLAYGPGADPGSFTDIATGDTLPAPMPLATWDVSALDDGTYTLRLSAVDKAGNAAAARVTVSVDNTSPEVALSAPDDGDYVTQPGTIAGTVSDPNLAEYALEVAPAASNGAARSVLVSSVVAPAGGALHDWQLLPPDGAYDLFLSATDAAGNAAEVSIAINVDTTAPARPQGLTGVVEGDSDVRLRWSANAEPDIDGYFVLRDGVRLHPTPVPDPEYLDSTVEDGAYDYTVIAVDLAGLESEPSDPARVALDTTPPRARVLVPADAALVSGIVDVTGTAFSDGDFKEYRVYVGPSATPQARQLLRRSPVPVQAESLASWNTLGLPEGETFLLTLEAEDVNGNVADETVTVSVDNTPPAVPTGLAAVATGPDVRVDWDPNAELDLRGYLLFRDERLANVDGVALGDLRQFALPGEGYDDGGVPDGVRAYQVAAIDEAGNISDLSLPVDVSIDTRAPHAVIVQPADGATFEQPVHVLATSEDTDVDTVQFEYRRPADVSWTALDAADASVPYTVTLDGEAIGLGFEPIELRAVATDLAGQVDPEPTPITLTRADLTRPDAVLGAGARVDGGDVTVTWEASTAPDLDGYHVERALDDGDFERLTGALLTEATYLDTGLADGELRYRVIALDTFGNEADPSDAVDAVVYTPVIDTAFTPTQAVDVTLTGRGIGSADLSGEVVAAAGATPLPAISTDAGGAFTLADVPLASGRNTVTIRLTDAAGNVSKPAQTIVSRGAPPAPPTGLAASVTGFDATLIWDANAEPDLLGYAVYRDGEPALPDTSTPYTYSVSPDARTALAVLPGVLLVVGIEVDWDELVADFDVDVLVDGQWVNALSVRGSSDDEGGLLEFRQPYPASQVRLVLVSPGATANALDGSYEVLVDGLVASPTHLDQALVDGVYSYTVTALSTLGFESLPSDPAEAEVGDTTGPDAVILTAVVTGADVALNWTASTAPDVDHYDLYRDGERIAAFGPVTLDYVDRARPNGTYEYSVRGVDTVGNDGEESNLASAVVEVLPPEAPTDLVVTAPAEGGRLDLEWSAPLAGTPPVAYRVLRAEGAGGPYDDVGGTAVSLVFVDADVTNGVTYHYVVVGLDEAANEGASSNEASGTAQDAIAPAPPVIDFPTVPGVLFESAEPQTDVRGSTEPESTVELIVNGISLGEVASFGASFDAGGVDGPSPSPGNQVDLSVVRLSPDGRYLLYGESAIFAGVRLIFLHEMAGGERITVASLDSSTTLTSASWAPDGRAVYYTTETVVGASGIERNAWVYDLDADTVTPVPAQAGLSVWSIEVSPDGSRLAAAATADVLSAPQLWVKDVGEATYSPVVGAPGGAVARRTLSWSHDGSRIAYVNGEALEVAEVETGDVETVDLMVSENRADWAPDGRLLYSGIDAFNFIAMARIYSPEGLGVADVAVDALAPRWAGDGQRIVFVRGEEQVIDHELASREESVVFDTLLEIDPRSLQVLADDRIGFAYAGGEYLLTSRLARFEFAGVELLDGDNVVNAIAIDEAGNRSDPSASIVVAYDDPGLPDLVLDGASIELLPNAPLTGEPVLVGVTVRNDGPQPAAVSDLSVLVIDPAGGSAQLLDRVALPGLAPGASTVRTVEWTVGLEPGIYSIVAIADVNDRVFEQSEANNFALREVIVPERQLPAIAVSVDGRTFGAGDEVPVATAVTNAGPLFDGSVRLSIEDAGGFEVVELATAPIEALAYGVTLERADVWNTGQTFAGPYAAVARLLDAAGAEIGVAEAPLAVVASASFEASVARDRPAYSANDTVRASGAVTYIAGNRVVSGSLARLLVVDAAGSSLAERSVALGDLLPGASTSLTLDWNVGLTAPGDYTVRAEIVEDGVTLAEAGTTFPVEPSGLAVGGDLSLTELAPTPGIAQGAVYAVRNDGNAPVAALPVTVALLDPAAGVVLAERVATVDIPVGGSVEASVEFATDGLAIGSYTMQLSAVPTSAPAQVLDSAVFTVVDRAPPAVELRSPTDGAFVRGDSRGSVFAVDDDASVARVEFRIDGGAWQPASVQSVAESLYGGALPGLTDGVHTLEARAFDTSENEGRSALATFTVNNAGPEIVVNGVSDGEHRAAPAVPVVTISDPALTVSAIALNGVSFESGSTVDVEGDYQLTAYAANAAGNSTEVIVEFTIDATPPSILVDGVVDGDARNDDVTPVVTVEDPNLAVQSVTLDGEPFTSGTTLSEEADHVLTVEASDRAGNTSSLTIGFHIDKTPPRIVVEGVESGRVYDGGEPYVYDVDAIDPDGDPIDYELSVAPAGMSIDPVTGLVTFKPRAAGDVVVRVRVVDPSDEEDTQTYTLTVEPPNAPPVIESSPIGAATAGVGYVYDVSASDFDGDALTYSLTEAPPDMQIDAVTGLVTWTPAEAGQYTVTLRVEDEHGASTEQTFTLQVAPDPLGFVEPLLVRRAST